MKAATPITMWAALIQGARSEWVHPRTIRQTRKDARAAYLELWEPKYHRLALKKVRFARVVVSLEHP